MGTVFHIRRYTHPQS